MKVYIGMELVDSLTLSTYMCGSGLCTSYNSDDYLFVLPTVERVILKIIPYFVAE
jgi:hypothetical protein